MKLSLILALVSVFTNIANAGLPPTTTKASGDSSRITTFNFEFPNFTVSRSGVTTTFGTLGIAGGGTGQTAKTAAFDALSPMSASGDIIYGGTSGTGTRLAKGSDTQVLTLASGLPSWAAAPTANSSYLLQNLGLSVTASAGTMTVALKQADGSTNPASGTGAVVVGFRDATAANGDYTLVSTTAALSLTIGTTTTLGGASGISYPVYVYLVNNAGTTLLAASLNLYDEGTVQSTSTTTTSNQVIYAGSAVSSKSIRLIGRFRATNTASSWGSPTEVSLVPSNLSNNVSAKYYMSGNTTPGAATQLNYDTKLWDTHNAVTTGASWKFTAPYPGRYVVRAVSNLNNATTSDLSVYKNGTNNSYLYNQGTAGVNSGSTEIDLVAGDFIDIRGSAASQYHGTAAPYQVHVTITRVGD